MLRQVSYPVLLSWFNNLYELNQSTDGRPGGESNRARWFMGVKSCCGCRTIPSCQPQTPRAKSCRVWALSTIRVLACDLCRNRRLSCLNYVNNRWPCYISKRMYSVWTFAAEVLTDTETSVRRTSCPTGSQTACQSAGYPASVVSGRPTACCLIARFIVVISWEEKKSVESCWEPLGEPKWHMDVLEMTAGGEMKNIERKKKIQTLQHTKKWEQGRKTEDRVCCGVLLVDSLD